MNTSIATNTKLSPDALRAEEALDRKLAKLRAELAARTDEEARAVNAFRKDPSEQTATGKLIAEQKRANADEALQALEQSTETKAVRAAAQRERDSAELEALRAEFANWNELIGPEREAIVAAFAVCMRTVREQCKSLQGKLEARHKVLSKLNNLSRIVGDGTQYPSVSFGAAINWVDGAIRSEVATYSELYGHGGARPIVLRAVTQSALGDFLHFEHRMPVNNLSQELSAPFNHYNEALLRGER